MTNDRTGPELRSIAGRVLGMKGPAFALWCLANPKVIRSAFASLLNQSPDRRKRPPDDG